MIIVKALLILVLTLFWAVISLVVLHSPSSPYTPIALVSLIYILLVYLIWPLGTTYSEVAFNRFYIVFGIATLLLASDVLLNNQCPSFPFSSVTAIPKSQGLAADLLFTCIYLGKVPTTLLLCLFSGWLIYLGHTKKLNPSLKRDW
jgi:hypothetical protein